MKNTKLIYECPECSTEVPLEVSPIVPEVAAGPPENWCQSEGGEIEPDKCPVCNRTFDAAVIYAMADEQRMNERDRAREYDAAQREDE